MAWARGRQEKGYSAKAEALKKYPQAVCKRVHYSYSGFETMYALYEHKGDERPMLVRKTAEEAWEDALSGARH
jgi:hypothetical protein